MRLSLRRLHFAGALCLLVPLCLAALASLRYATARQAAPKYFQNTGQTLTVTTTNDSGSGSLRQAIADAQDNDTIQFDSALNGQIITLTTDELVIDKNITILGPGTNLLTVTRFYKAPAFRIFDIHAGHTVVIQGLTISGGLDYGGAILNSDSNLTVISCIIRDNVSPGSGGAIFNSGNTGTATLTILDSMIIDNRANSWGGAIYNQAADFTGGAYLTLTNTVLSYNQATGLGGGIFSLMGTNTTLNNCTITHNTAGPITAPTPGGSGGGIATNGCTLTINNTTISNNQSGDAGGGLENYFGTMTITNSSLIYNHAVRGGGINNVGRLTISNSTVSSNHAGVSGGGVLNTFGNGDERLTITNSTLSDNSADQNGGGIANYAPLEIGDTILDTGSAGANISNDGGTVTSLGYNLSNDDGGGFLSGEGDQINTEPYLSPLQNNGGPTWTQLPWKGSPAIDRGNPDFTPPPLTDQRGYLRVFNDRIDIGSVETQLGPTPAPSPLALKNISTRVRVETGANTLIGGFIITGVLPRSLIVRGIGPSLANFGVPDVLLDPTLELRDNTGALEASNDNWQDDPNAKQLPIIGLAPSDPAESAFLRTINPGMHTAIVAGKDGGTGVALVEVYDVTEPFPGTTAQLGNISTRGLVGTDTNVMIGGFVLNGESANAAIVVRGIGPSLTQFGVPDALADPTLELRNFNGTLMMANDNWQDDPAMAEQLTAHGLAPTDPNESGIYISLAPSLYTAILAGKNRGVGVGLVEIYNLQ